MGLDGVASEKVGGDRRRRDSDHRFAKEFEFENGPILDAVQLLL